MRGSGHVSPQETGHLASGNGSDGSAGGAEQRPLLWTEAPFWEKKIRELEPMVRQGVASVVSAGAHGALEQGPLSENRAAGGNADRNGLGLRDAAITPAGVGRTVLGMPNSRPM